MRGLLGYSVEVGFWWEGGTGNGDACEHVKRDSQKLQLEEPRYCVPAGFAVGCSMLCVSNWLHVFLSSLILMVEEGSWAWITWQVTPRLKRKIPDNILHNCQINQSSWSGKPSGIVANWLRCNLHPTLPSPSHTLSITKIPVLALADTVTHVFSGIPFPDTCFITSSEYFYLPKYGRSRFNSWTMVWPYGCLNPDLNLDLDLEV